MVIALASFPLFALGSARSRGLRLSASTPLVELAPRGSTADRSPLEHAANGRDSGEGYCEFALAAPGRVPRSPRPARTAAGSLAQGLCVLLPFAAFVTKV